MREGNRICRLKRHGYIQQPLGSLLQCGKNYVAGFGKIKIGVPGTKVYPSLSAHPMPAFIFIYLTGEKLVGSTYTIYDQSGRLMTSSKVQTDNPQLDISNLPNGVYLLRLDGQHTQSFENIEN